MTGGASRLGTAISTAFGREGARVAITYHGNREAAEKVAVDVEAAGGSAHVLPFSLDDAGSAGEVVSNVVGRWGAIDVLVNCAVRWPETGPGPRLTSFDQTAEWEAELDANLKGTMRITHAALPVIRHSGAGRVVTLSTIHTQRGVPNSALYTAAKAGLHGLTRSLAWEVGPDGVLVNIVMPGFVQPPFIPPPLALVVEEHRRLTPTGELATARQVADTVVFLCSAANGGITGEIVRVSGGYL